MTDSEYGTLDDLRNQVRELDKTIRRLVEVLSGSLDKPDGISNQIERFATRQIELEHEVRDTYNAIYKDNGFRDRLVEIERHDKTRIWVTRGLISGLLVIVTAAIVNIVEWILRLIPR